MEGERQDGHNGVLRPSHGSGSLESLRVPIPNRYSLAIKPAQANLEHGELPGHD